MVDPIGVFFFFFFFFFVSCMEFAHYDMNFLKNVSWQLSQYNQVIFLNELG